VFVLLRPKADHPNLTGVLSYKSAASSVEFRYEVIRLWKQTAESSLTAGLGIAPLAVLGALPEDMPETEALRIVAGRLDTRLLNETTPDRAAKLMKAAYHLTVLRIPRAELGKVFRREGNMKAAYDEWLEEGATKRTQKFLLMQGRSRFGSPKPAVELIIQSINDLERLDRMGVAILHVNDWDELLKTE